MRVLLFVYRPRRVTYFRILAKAEDSIPIKEQEEIAFPSILGFSYVTDFSLEMMQ